MTRTLPATGLTLPDETTGWSLSTPRHSDCAPSQEEAGCRPPSALTGTRSAP